MRFLLIAIALGTVAAAVIAKSPWLLIVGLASVLFLTSLGRLWVELDADSITVQSWFSRKTLRWQDITSVKRTDELPWPRNRCYGPSTHELSDRSGAARVNLLYFDSGFAREFHAAIAEWQRRRSAGEQSCQRKAGPLAGHPGAR